MWSVNMVNESTSFVCKDKIFLIKATSPDVAFIINGIILTTNISIYMRTVILVTWVLPSLLLGIGEVRAILVLEGVDECLWDGA